MVYSIDKDNEEKLCLILHNDRKNKYVSIILNYIGEINYANVLVKDAHNNVL